MIDFTISDSIYSNVSRIRVCGLLKKEKSILLLKHDNLGSLGYLWSPPGGGVSFGSSVEETLIREFKEETNLDVKIVRFLFVNEYLDKKYHAIELFFEVNLIGGELKLGFDPEVPKKEQILSDVQFISFEELIKKNKASIHNCFSYCEHPEKVFDLRGFFKFDNI